MAASLTAGLGHRWGLWDASVGLGIFVAAAITALLSVVVSIAGGVFALRDASKGKTLAAALGIALGFTLAGFLHAQVQILRRVPRIHDITTDTQNPPAFLSLLPLRKGAENPPGYEGARIAALQKKGYPDIRPLTFRASGEEIFRRALAAADAMGWQVVSSRPGEGIIEAYDATFWFGFRDDVVIRVTRSGETTRLDVRSKSRVGVSDVGANARRIRGFSGKLRRE